MNMEIEAKIKVAELASFAEKLKDAGAAFKQAERHHDSYFIDKGDGLSKSDRGLRLRQLDADGERSVFLTYKGPRQGGPFKSREELEVRVDDFETMSAMLVSLGFEKTLEFEKKRRVWLLDGCEVCLDELPVLGSFVEIEGPEEKAISGVLAKMGLAEKEHISEGYSRIMADALKDAGRQSKSVLFGEAGEERGI
ncbi:putative adenylyl cyclase CyaB [Anaerohalosphaera lusitana]|uniref:Putative adenylyl cyclase CyaB n=1 Tax=Anaerohalosphaera lusitana TaxID=1936003 RepID=A0A1U9NL39_9BACT|nr:class IV adenylate cyclase [Anaerohalosphaera lusitana]AQT68300.1 putative adenylyl cyclase CyaB [Anaerohalosphaera lusitana]